MVDFKQKIKVSSSEGEIKNNSEMYLSESLEDHTQSFKIKKIFHKNLLSQFVNKTDKCSVDAGVFNNGTIFNGTVRRNNQKGDYLEIEYEGIMQDLEYDATDFKYTNTEIKKVFENVAKVFGLKLKWDSKIKNEKISRSDIMQSSGSEASGDDITGTGKPSCSFCSKLPHKNYTSSFKNKCGRCGKTGLMSDTPKGGRAKVPEGEWTCDTAKGGCGADFCMVCGKEKMDPAKGWLTQVNVPEGVRKG